MPDRFDDLMREKLGGFHMPSGPGSGAGRDADMEADWSAMAERLDAVEAARGRKSDSRIGLLLFAFILVGSIGMGLWYQLDGRSPIQEELPQTRSSENGSASTGIASDATRVAPSPAPQTKGRAASESTNGQAVAGKKPDAAAARVSPAGENGSDPALASSMDLPSTNPGHSAQEAGSRATHSDAVAADAAGMAPRTAAPSAYADKRPANSTRAAQNADAQPLPGSRTSRSTSPMPSGPAAGAESAQNSAAPSGPHAVDRMAADRADAGTPAGAANRSASAELQSPGAAHAETSSDQLALNRASDASRAANASLPSVQDLAAFKVWPAPVDPIAAQAGPYLEPEPRNTALDADFGKRDPSLQKAPLRYTLTFGPDLNAAITGVGDALKPSWDLSLSGELWFPKQVFISAGLRYGMYRFHKVNVQCGNHEAHGVSDHVHCPDAMTGNQALWEIPLRVGYGLDVAKGKGRIRAFAGVSARVQRAADYAVEFHNVGAGDTLFFDPVVITVAETGTYEHIANYSYDTDVLESMANASNNFVADPATSNSNDALNTSNKRTSLALEFGLGYEQFLGPNVSLGVEPRLALPLQALPMNNGRAYHVAAGALLRWYPGR